LRVAVALRAPKRAAIAQLAEAGIDELVLVDAPPADPEDAANWVGDLAGRWA
jgi:hypothetical protein